MARITQTGSQLAGTVFVLEHLCVTGFSATGESSGSQVRLTLVGAGGDRTEFSGTLAGDRRTMSGTYEMFGGLCPGSAGSADRGTWTLSKIQ